MSKPHSLLMRQAEADPVGFASLCGKIDSIAHLKHTAKELSDKQHEKAKQVSGDPLTHLSHADPPQDQATTRVEGEQLCAAMMSCRKRATSSSENLTGGGDTSEQVEMRAETSVDTTGEADGVSRVSKQARSGTLSHRDAKLDMMISVALDQRKDQREYHEDLMAMHKCACDFQLDQEHTSLVLLDILHQSLLPPQ